MYVRDGRGVDREVVQHDLQIEETPRAVFGIVVHVAEVDTRCGCHNGSACTYVSKDSKISRA